MRYIYDGTSFINKRQINMDSIFLKEKQIEFNQVIFAIVCDGVGSLSDGAYASSVSVKLLKKWFDEELKIEDIGTRLREKIEYINRYIVETSKSHRINTATTLSALLIIDGVYQVFHIGDSRIYSFDNKSICIITQDDISPSGKLTDYIGKASNFMLHRYEGVAIDKVFLICSDGFYKNIDINFLLPHMKNIDSKNIKKIINSLINHVTASGEQDNISLALIKIES